jgi:integrase
VEYEALRDNVQGKGRQFYSLGFHALGHSFVSTMANLGVPEEMRKIVGHSNVDLRHTPTRKEDRREGIEEISQTPGSIAHLPK